MSEGVRAFFRNVQRCRLCYGDRCDIVVPSPAQIPERVRVLIVGEQPHHSGALNGHNGMGDREAGLENLETYLARAGVDRSEILYVTAVLCVPKDASLRGPRPAAAEVKNCSSHLRVLIDRVQPKLIVTLGHTALLSVQFAFHDWTELRQFILNYDIGTVLSRHDLSIYPLYLPTSATWKTRPDGRQLRDWQKVANLLVSLEKAERTG